MSKDGIKVLRGFMLGLFGMGIVLSVVHWDALAPLFAFMLGFGALMYVLLEPAP